MVILQPPKGKVIIRKDEPKSVTPGGIILRPRDRNKSFTAVIVSGSNTYRPGDKIIFVPRVSSTINFRGENLVIISEDDILATYD